MPSGHRIEPFAHPSSLARFCPVRVPQPGKPKPVGNPPTPRDPDEPPPMRDPPPPIPIPPTREPPPPMQARGRRRVSLGGSSAPS
jgi:hypothetical protein